ncbi:SUKH-4 family immunity protein [Micromonospora sp. NBC_00389]|uniref:SUKH-4 family immunity protein n=1 Tax=Micromonospora sp. NBC_00389 TaxID=2903586 RepID=UPI002E1BA811
MPNLIRYSESDLRQIFGGVVAPGASGLLDVELPREVDVFFHAYPIEAMSVSAEPRRLPIGRAWHGVCEVQIDLANGSVWSVVPVENSAPEVTFMNSDIGNFVVFLRYMAGMAALAETESGRAYRERAEAVRRELVAVDEPATREGAWWSAITEEMVEMG